VRKVEEGRRGRALLEEKCRRRWEGRTEIRGGGVEIWVV